MRTGVTYCDRYGYRLDDALRAEFWWRLEHAPLSGEGLPFERLSCLAYGRRKAAERRGVARRIVRESVGRLRLLDVDWMARHELSPRR